jgi:hypothetical protein
MATKTTYQPLLSEWVQYTEGATTYDGFTRAVQNARCREMLIRATGAHGKSGQNEEEITLTIGADHFYYLFNVKDPVHSALDGLKHWLTAHGYRITVLHHQEQKTTYYPSGITNAQVDWMENAAAILGRGEVPEADTPLKQRLLEEVREDLASLATEYTTNLLIRAPPRVGLPSRKYINASSWKLPEDLTLVCDKEVELRISSALVKLRGSEYPNPSGNLSWFDLYFSDTFKGSTDHDPEHGVLDFRQYRFVVLRGFKIFLIDPEGFRNELIEFPSVHYMDELLKLSKYLMFDSFTYFLLSIGERLEQNNVNEFAPETVKRRISLTGENPDKQSLYPGFVADFAGDHLELAPAINARLWNNRSYSDYIVALLNLPDGPEGDDSYIREHAPDMRSFRSFNILTIKKDEEFTYFFGSNEGNILYVRPHKEGSLILAIGKRTVDFEELMKLHGHDHRFRVCLNKNRGSPETEADPEARMYLVQIDMLRFQRRRHDDFDRGYTLQEINAEFPPDNDEEDE